MKFIATILILGALFFLSIQILPTINKNNDNGGFLASVVSFLNDYLGVGGGIKGIISVINKENFSAGNGSVYDGKESEIRFNGKINIFDVKISSNNQDLIFAASDRGLFISRGNGLNWQSFSDKENKINAKTEVYKILFGSSGLSFISVFQNNKGIIYQSRDNFSSLRKILEFNDASVNDFDIFENNLYAGLSDGRLIFYSMDDQSFKILTGFDSGIVRLKVEAEGLIYLTLKDGGFYVSNDNGLYFKKMKFLDDFHGADKIFDFTVDSQNSSLIYAATDYGFIRSQNSGLTWEIFRSLPVKDRKILILALNGSKEIFAADYGNIYKSRDGGKNWQILYPEIEDGREISAMAADEDKIIVGSKK